MSNEELMKAYKSGEKPAATAAMDGADGVTCACDAALKKPQTLEQHLKQYHGGKMPKGKCKFIKQWEANHPESTAKGDAKTDAAAKNKKGYRAFAKKEGGAGELTAESIKAKVEKAMKGIPHKGIEVTLDQPEKGMVEMCVKGVSDYKVNEVLHDAGVVGDIIAAGGAFADRYSGHGGGCVAMQMPKAKKDEKKDGGAKGKVNKKDADEYLDAVKKDKGKKDAEASAEEVAKKITDAVKPYWTEYAQAKAKDELNGRSLEDLITDWVKEEQADGWKVSAEDGHFDWVKQRIAHYRGDYSAGWWDSEKNKVEKDAKGRLIGGESKKWILNGTMYGFIGFAYATKGEDGKYDVWNDSGEQGTYGFVEEGDIRAWADHKQLCVDKIFNSKEEEVRAYENGEIKVCDSKNGDLTLDEIRENVQVAKLPPLSAESRKMIEDGYKAVKKENDHNYLHWEKDGKDAGRVNPGLTEARINLEIEKMNANKDGDNKGGAAKKPNYKEADLSNFSDPMADRNAEQDITFRDNVGGKLREACGGKIDPFVYLTKGGKLAVTGSVGYNSHEGKWKLDEDGEKEVKSQWADALKAMGCKNITFGNTNEEGRRDIECVCEPPASMKTYEAAMEKFAPKNASASAAKPKGTSKEALQKFKDAKAELHELLDSNQITPEKLNELTAKVNAAMKEYEELADAEAAAKYKND